jgi:hypothetical protein
MSWIDWTCLGVLIAGFVLFVYGANAYDAVVGWLGVFLGIGAVAVVVANYAYKELTKGQKAPQNP